MNTYPQHPAQPEPTNNANPETSDTPETSATQDSLPGLGRAGNPPDKTLTPLADGAWHLPNWLPTNQQHQLIHIARTIATGPIPAHRPLIAGNPMSVWHVSAGWHWQPYQYSKTATNVNGARCAPMPVELVELADRVHRAVYGQPAEHDYDVAAINFYPPGAKMGMHQDNQEVSELPILSLSMGDDAIFRLGNCADRGQPYQDVRLASGDVVTFGGPARRCYHGVPKVFVGTGPAELGIKGRLNVTLRHSGLG